MRSGFGRTTSSPPIGLTSSAVLLHPPNGELSFQMFLQSDFIWQGRIHGDIVVYSRTFYLTV